MVVAVGMVSVVRGVLGFARLVGSCVAVAGDAVVARAAGAVS